MKKAPILLLICMLLCGCDAGDNGITNVSSLTPPTERPADLRGLSASRSAVSAFPLGIEDAYGIRNTKDGILVFSGKENTTLTLLAGETLEILDSCTLDCHISHQDPSVTEQGLTLYLAHRRETLWLDPQLREVQRIPDPAALTGAPLFNPLQNTLYYCTDNAILAWDLGSNVHRTLKELSYSHQELTGLFFDGSILQCRILDGSREANLFLSTKNGTLLQEHPGPITMEDYRGTYYAQFPNGSVESLVFGVDACQPQALVCPEKVLECTFIKETGCAVIRSEPSEGTVVLTVYHLETGTRMSSLVLSSQASPIAITGDKDGAVYLLCPGTDGQSTLYRWDYNQDVRSDSRIYTQLHHTRQQPDQAGLENCRAYAQKLSDRYGIRILVGKDAAAIQPWDYDLEPEHLVTVLMDGLNQLDRYLSSFPLSVLEDTASHFSSLTVCLLRQVRGAPESGSMDAVPGIQFLDGMDAYIALTLGSTMEASFYHELFHVMDTHLLGNTGELDRWDELNPAGFAYDYSYSANRERNSGVYLQHNSRAFVDTYSMSYPKEDKARIMEYAMLPGNAGLFQIPTLQQKLKTLCSGIRDAYDLPKEETYLWEQYLE